MIGHDFDARIGAVSGIKIKKSHLRWLLCFFFRSLISVSTDEFKN